MVRHWVLVSAYVGSNPTSPAFPSTMERYVVILAAGKGTRMKSEMPKVMHTLKGKAMVHYVLDSLNGLGIKKVVIVIGFKKEMVMESINQWKSKANPDFPIEFAEQPLMRGTGEAVMVTEPYFSGHYGSLAVLLGDVPLIRKETILSFFEVAQSNPQIPIVVSMKLDNPKGYGRILRDSDNSVQGIVEEKDASDNQKKITEVNTGIFVLPIPQVWEHLHSIESNNSQKEYYLTDIIEIYRKRHLPFHAVQKKNPLEFTGINSREQLEEIERGIYG